MCADRSTEILETFALVADSLTGDFPDEAIRQFDSSMPGYNKLRAYFFSLTEAYDVSCKAKLLSHEGESDEIVEASLEWSVTIRNKNVAATVDTRTKTVTAKLKRNGKKWKIASFDGIELFNPRIVAR